MPKGILIRILHTRKKINTKSAGRNPPPNPGALSQTKSPETRLRDFFHRYASEAWRFIVLKNSWMTGINFFASIFCGQAFVHLPQSRQASA